MRQTKNAVDPYREIVEYYDLEHDAYRDDIGLIEHLVDTVGDPILELACGTGRVMAPLAREGRRLTGVDLSRPMLDACRERLMAVEGSVELIEADITNLPLDEAQFGVAILAMNGLLHATTPDSQRAVLAEAFRCLDPRGMLYLDIANPLVSWPSSGLQAILLEGSWTTADNSVQKFQSVSVDQASQSVRSTIWYDIVEPTGEMRRLSTSFDLRYLHAPELELMLELSGFVEWQIYGSYDLDPYTSESPRIIALAEKTPSH